MTALLPRNRLALALALTSWGAFAQSAAPDAGPQLQEAQIAYMNCLARIEPSIDDQVSDAATIARSLREACPEEFSRLLSIRLVGYTPNQQRMIEESAASIRLDIALDVVLKVRAAKARLRP